VDSIDRKKMRIDASWMKAKKLAPSLSYLVPMRLKFLSLLKKRST
jgi:hypothetical protein